MIWDISQGVISFEINYSQVHTTAVEMKEKKYFPFLCVSSRDSEVTFLYATLTN